MLNEFLLTHQEEILAATEAKTIELAGTRQSSNQLKRGLPIFLNQLLGILNLHRPAHRKSQTDHAASMKGVDESDESAMAIAAGQPEEAELARSAGVHGAELFRLGYTLSHVVHAYGAMCQAITELAARKNQVITAAEFHDLNQCLDVGIAGAVTEYQSIQTTEETSREVRHLGFLAHEMRNALTSANISFKMIKKGAVGIGGNTGQVLENSLKRIEELIDRSLTEVRLRVDPEVHVETGHLLQVLNQILVTAEVEAQARGQKIEVKVDPTLVFEADQQAFHSALSNLIQNAIKYSRDNARIQVRGSVVGANFIVEVEDQCGGLLIDTAPDLFMPFVQDNENRKGLGLGLTIARRAIRLNHGTIEARNLPGQGCVFKITLPKGEGAAQKDLKVPPAA
jgi:signal transduction histidine kinase